MSVRLLLTAGLATLLLSGCRNDPRTQVYLDNVNAEKRLLEDTLYDLQYDYECSLQEADRLRNQLTQLQSGTPTTGTSRPAAGSGGKSDAPSAPGDNMFPQFPDLKPPTVESGTPTRPKPPTSEGPPPPADADGTKPKAGEGNKRDIDDLEPPTLDLGDEQTGTSLEPKPLEPKPLELEAIEPEAAEPARGTGPAQPGKTASRWTPRADRPPETPARRIDVAESPDQPRADANPPASGGSTGGTSEASSANPSGAGSVQKQAQRPQWRPYR